MQSDNQPLHTLLGLRQHWAPLLVPSLLRERSTCQDVDCCSQAAPKQDNNSADWAFMCYYITYMYINTHGARKRSEQRQSFDWGTTIRARCCRVKKFSFLWITKVWLIEIEFFPPLVPRQHDEFKDTNELLEKSGGLKCCGRSFESNVRVIVMRFLKTKQPVSYTACTVLVTRMRN